MFSVKNNSLTSSVYAALRQFNSDLVTTQKRIGTGLKINVSSDNPSAYEQSQSIRADLTSQANLESGIAIAKARVDAALSALDAFSSALAKIKDLSVQATNAPPANGDYSSYTSQITALQSRMIDVLGGAGFAGENWLTDAAATKVVVVGVSKGNATTLSLATFQFAGSPSYAGDKASIEALSAVVDGIQTFTADHKVLLSSFSAALDTQKSYLAVIRSIGKSVLSSIVDANLDEESAKVTALQTKQKLAYQAISIGNASSRYILGLFD